MKEFWLQCLISRWEAKSLSSVPMIATDSLVPLPLCCGLRLPMWLYQELSSQHKPECGGTAYDPNIKEAEGGGTGVWGQPVVHNKILSPKNSFEYMDCEGRCANRRARNVLLCSRAKMLLQDNSSLLNSNQSLLHIGQSSQPQGFSKNAEKPHSLDIHLPEETIKTIISVSVE